MVSISKRRNNLSCWGLVASGWITGPGELNGADVCEALQRGCCVSICACCSKYTGRKLRNPNELCENLHYSSLGLRGWFPPKQHTLQESFWALSWRTFFRKPLPLCISQRTADVNRQGTSQPGMISSLSAGRRLCHVRRAIRHISSLTQ